MAENVKIGHFWNPPCVKFQKMVLEVKKNYPSCVYDPPRVLSCDTNCPNPLCPGELLPNRKYSKMKEEKEEKEVINL